MEPGAEPARQEPLGEVPGFVRDLLDLFKEWEQMPGNEFKHFRAIWSRRELSYLYHAKYDKVSKEKWMQALCGAAYAYFLVDSPKAHFGSFYCLFMLWSVQPVSLRKNNKKPPRPKLPIQISLVLWRKIKALLEQPTTVPGVIDCLAIYRKLRADPCGLQFAITVEVLPPPHLWPTSSTNLPLELQYCDTLRGVIDTEAIRAMSKRHYDITRGEITQQFANLELPTNLQNVLDEAKSKVAKILGTDVETPAPAISVIAPEPPPVPMEVEKAEEMPAVQEGNEQGEVELEDFW